MRGQIHFIGICGVAMSALALAFKESDWEVTGSDVGFFPPISDYLKNHDVKFYPGWHPDRVLQNFSGGGKNDEIVVVGNVAGSTNPELLYARKNNLNCKSYPEVVAEYVVQKNSLVCAGTYGKTSSAALLTLILKNAGLDPTYMFGGLSLNLPESAKICTPRLGGEDLQVRGGLAYLPLTKREREGVAEVSAPTPPTPSRAEGDVDNQPTPTPPKRGIDGWSVLEGDEYKTARWDSRPKFKLYSPTHLLLTSVSWDHADIYPTEETYFNAFKDLTAMVPARGLIVACVDAKNMDKILAANANNAKVITYGKNQDADYCYFDVKQTKDGVNFKIQNKHKAYELFSSVLGEHMAENICGAFALAKEIGVEENTILNSIAEFKGIKRRLEKRSANGLIVYDDLGHSPAKAAAALKTLRAIYPANKITAVFEPNTGNRKSLSAPGYAGAFADANEVIIPALTKIKIDPKDPDPPFDGQKLQEVISETHPTALFIDNDEKLLEHLKKKKGGVIVFLGSHGFRGMIDLLINSISRA